MEVETVYSAHVDSKAERDGWDTHTRTHACTHAHTETLHHHLSPVLYNSPTLRPPFPQMLPEASITPSLPRQTIPSHLCYLTSLSAPNHNPQGYHGDAGERGMMEIVIRLP